MRRIDRGMKVNSKKTMLLCVSGALSYTAEANIRDLDGSVITSEGVGDLKMLGFHFSGRPNVNEHLEVLKKRFRARYWI